MKLNPLPLNDHTGFLWFFTYSLPFIVMTLKVGAAQQEKQEDQPLIRK